MSDSKGKGKAVENEGVAIIVIGMAGSGKTTLLQRLNSYLHTQKTPPYVVNLDPAVFKLPFQCQIDIRDTIDYKQVMSSYNLGPNGGILTSLNLFTTKFDQVLALIQKRKATTKHFLIDTPGQIEIFTWSASGAIITDSLASELPTVVAYIVDTPRTASPSTFMSNMLYACSILYKTKLPFLLVFNKTDVHDHKFALGWMRDYEAFQMALAAKREKEGESGSGYMNSLMNSMALVLDEFYKNLRAVGVSAVTGAGMEDFFDAVNQLKQEYYDDYKPELEKLRSERKAEQDMAKQDSINRLMKDMNVNSQPRAKPIPGDRLSSRRMMDERYDSNEDDADEDEGDIIDRNDAHSFNIGSRREPGVHEDGELTFSHHPHIRSVQEIGLGGRWPSAH